MNLIEACQDSLTQAELLLRRLDPARYQAPQPACFGASIGQHIRHCLDHYEQFLDGLASGLLDYDSRKRNPAIETNPDSALAHIAALRERLGEDLRSPDETRAVQVKIDCGGNEPCTRPSTIGRELQFLISHNIHHFAIVAMLCRSMGIQLEPGFGVAPSTIRHRTAEEASLSAVG